MAGILDVTSWTPRPWDSAFFGVSIGQITPHPQAAAELAETLRAAEQASIDCLYLLAEADDAEIIRAADANGFALVDVRLTLECEVGAALLPEPSASMRLACPADLPQLTALARVSHRNTRFHQDARFDRARSDELYAVWIERSVRGELADAVFVVDRDGAPRGYLAVRAGEEEATIGLVAVEAGYRGQGHGEELLHAALRWTAARRLPRVSVVTQGRSEAAVRFYHRAGFKPTRTQLWYHRWLRA
jgi:ribosomal protein S18 acetylase RimI-like enzyme